MSLFLKQQYQSAARDYLRSSADEQLQADISRQRGDAPTYTERPTGLRVGRSARRLVEYRGRFSRPQSTGANVQGMTVVPGYWRTEQDGTRTWVRPYVREN